MRRITVRDLALKAIEKFREIEGLRDITPEDCCKLIGVCGIADTYSIEKEKAPDDDAAYKNLVSQITGLCTNRVSLANETLGCQTRNKNLRKSQKTYFSYSGIRQFLLAGVELGDLTLPYDHVHVPIQSWMEGRD